MSRARFTSLSGGLLKLSFAFPLLLLFGMQVGCDNKEEVLDVETPTSELEVTEDPETGETDVEVEGEAE